MLHLMSGLLKIQQGRVEIAGQDLALLSESELDRFRGQHVGFIFQKNHLISALSVEKNLLMAPFLANVRQSNSRVEEVLKELSLEEKRTSGILQLSQGQAQRVAIARAVLNRPDVIFADEPTSALDDENCARVIRLLLDVSAHSRSTLVVATHDQRLKAVIADQVLIQNV